jgi:hypothetical protein
MAMDNLTGIATGLEKLGYVAEQDELAIVVRLDGGFAATLTINGQSELVITCQVATLGELREENLLTFFAAALDANSRIAPFAFSLITERDDSTIASERQYVVTLVDTVPLGDFEEQELEAAMQSLVTALVGSREVLEAGVQPLGSTAA